MNSEYPPFKIPPPQIANRRKEKPRQVPLSFEILQRRREIASRLIEQIRPLSRALHELSDEERKAIFYKLGHEIPVKLDGTSLKPLAEHSDRFTLAVPKEDNLDKFVNKIEIFAEGEIRKGHAPNERMASILSFARGDPKDRLSEALFEQYETLVHQEWIICEIEMVSLAKGKHGQREELKQIKELLQRKFSSSIHGSFFEQEDSAGTCRAVVRCTGQLFRELVENPEWQVRISWFDARPEFETFSSVLGSFSVSALGEFESPQETAPIVCIVDSGITIRNPFLMPVSRSNLIKSFFRNPQMQPNDEFGHGSGVASLVAYYALNLQPGSTNYGRVWIASARILDANNKVEDERLFSKILAQVVDTFEPLGIRIFNLSVNVTNRKWNKEAKRTIPRTSWIARTIDRLSREKDIVFVVSTGNILHREVYDYLASGQPYPSYFMEEEATLLDPAQAALALTVGSIAPGTLIVGNAGNATAIAEKNQPSPFTRRGPGINKEIKPELVDYGGNYVHDPNGGHVRSNPGTDVLMASHQLTPAIVHNSGSSFSTPRIAHKLALVLADLQEALNPVKISAPLLKAFLVNSANWERLGTEFSQLRDQPSQANTHQWRNIVGYGFPDAGFATDCDAFSVLLYYQGMLEADRIAYFDIPVPATLTEAGDGVKRLTVTLVHAPQVQRWGLERYLGNTMKWRMFRGDEDREDIIRAMSIEDGDDDEEQSGRPNDLRFELGVNLRSRGCVQHDFVEWSRHREQYSTANYTLAVAAYQKWNRKIDPIPYGIVVRLEDTNRLSQVYAQVRQLLTQIQVQTQSTP